MKKLWTDKAWEDYQYWLRQDKKMLKRVNALLKDIERNGNDGIGSPEPLTGNLSGCWSRRIDNQNRLVYRLSDNDTVEIYRCRTHYGEH
ncbi:MAG: Txe/YoeB family addiction module toxin [Synergistaceae bacterium]|nr:Txe/YoeB family addiction module toxin [Synergistaceae bacterium]